MGSTRTNDVIVSTETETKFELDAAAFERLKSAGLVKRCTKQLNVYYDSAWELAEQAGTFRVRFAQGSRPVVTLKIPVSSAQRHRVMCELETTPDRCFGGQVLPTGFIRVGAQLPAEFEDALLAIGISELCRVGWVRNERWSIDVSGDLLELDRLKLPNGETVYEAEIDTPNLAAHARLTNWVRHWAPTAKPSAISKFQRFRIAATTPGTQDSNKPYSLADRDEIARSLAMAIGMIDSSEDCVWVENREGLTGVKGLLRRLANTFGSPFQW